MAGNFDNAKRKFGYTNKEIFQSFIDWNNYIRVENLENSSEIVSFATSDNKFVVKLLEKSEVKRTLRVLKDYFERVTTNPDSKLLRMIGLFQVFPMKKYVLLMENFVNPSETSKIYEITGGKEGQVTEIQVNEAGVETIRSHKNDFERIQVGSQEFLESLEQDFMFLRRKNMIGYMLALAYFEKKPETGRTFTDINGKFYKISLLHYTSSTALSGCRVLCKVCLSTKTCSAKEYKRQVFNIITTIISP